MAILLTGRILWRPGQDYASPSPPRVRRCLLRVAQDTCPQKETRQRETELVKVCRSGFSARYYHQIPPPRDLRVTCHLAKSSFDSIAHYGVPDPLPHRKSEAAHALPVGKGRQDQRAVRPALASAPNLREVLRPFQALVSGHRALNAGWRHEAHTVSLWRPLNMRRRRTFRPPRVLILALKPCTRLRRRLRGWYVRFGKVSTPVERLYSLAKSTVN